MWNHQVFFLILLLATLVSALTSTTHSQSTTTSLVTGGNGYVGRAILHQLLQECSDNSNIHTIVSLVRPARVTTEQAYWQHRNEPRVHVAPYDMLDGGATLRHALESCNQKATTPSTTTGY